MSNNRRCVRHDRQGENNRCGGTSSEEYAQYEKRRKEILKNRKNGCQVTLFVWNFSFELVNFDWKYRSYQIAEYMGNSNFTVFIFRFLPFVVLPRSAESEKLLIPGQGHMLASCLQWQKCAITSSLRDRHTKGAVEGRGTRRGLHFSRILESRPKRRSPDPHLVGTTVELPGYIRGREFSKKIGIDGDRIEKFAREEGLKFKKNASDIILDFELCTKFLEKYGVKTKYKEVDAVRTDYWDSARTSKEYEKRPSVIGVMGEIDHGKTSLLDALSSSNVAHFEPGKITQSLSAFTVDLDSSKKSLDTNFTNSDSRVTFLDTPGHSAFEAMRTSGASVSDFILLVISATDGGVKPATERIIKMAQNHWVPIVVSINKIDIATEEQIVSIYKRLRKLGVSSIRRSTNKAMKMDFENLFAEVNDEHPVVSIVEISAKNHTNMNILKRVLKELHRSMEDNLHVNPNADPSEATVIESYASPGLGRVLLLVSHLGTLKVGQHFVTNNCSGVIKSLRIADQRHLSPNDEFSEGLSTSNTPHSSNSSNSSKSQPRPSWIKKENSNSKFEKKSHISDSDKRSTSREILEGSVGETVSMDSVGAGLPVLVSGLKQDFFIPSGSTFFGLSSKERADEIMDFRNTLLEFKMREKNGTLYRDDKHGLLIRAEARARAGIIDEKVEEEEDGEEEYAQEWEEEEDVEEERKNNISVILKADNQGRLDALILSARETAQEQGFELKLLAHGVGDITSHDLAIAQVEIEENGVPRIPLYLFNVELEQNAQQWMTKHSKLNGALLPRHFDVFLDILKDLSSEIKLKIARQAALAPLPIQKKNETIPRREESDKNDTAPRRSMKREKPLRRMPLKKR